MIRAIKRPIARLLSSSPLVRTSDRIEAAAVALAALLVVIAAPCAAGIGMIVHDNETQALLAQGQSRHVVTAKTVDDSRPAVSPIPSAFTVHVRWQFSGIDHADAILTDGALKVGEPLQIWVDNNGNRVDWPTPMAAVDIDAVTVAVAAWVIAAAVVALAVTATGVHVSRMRDAQWERDIRLLVGDDSGRTNSSQ
ncbi:Rv1733c family protein [Mycobacterium cookii]|uniref:Rv1733c family protein n=1 Tax=Mycobacterium cookii TaxID=1775 RepID=UPI003FD7983A